MVTVISKDMEGLVTEVLISPAIMTDHRFIILKTNLAAQENKNKKIQTGNSITLFCRIMTLPSQLKNFLNDTGTLQMLITIMENTRNF